MALPSINTPTHSTVLPFIKKEIEFRPFLVGEEKNLLLVAEQGETKDIVREVKNILKNCVISENVDIDNELTYIDVEWLFIQLRAKSKGEIASFSYKCNNVVEGETCGHVNEINVDLREAYTDYKTENYDGNIQLTDQIGVKLKLPTANEIFDMAEKENEEQDNITILAGMLEYVYDSETVYSEFTKQEAIDFFSKMTESQLEKVNEFLENLPENKLDFTFKCEKCGYEEEVELKGLMDFFG